MECALLKTGAIRFSDWIKIRFSLYYSEKAHLKLGRHSRQVYKNMEQHWF